MRTTLTLDPDVAVLLEKARETTKKSMKEIVNQALRRGLSEATTGGEPRESYATPPADLGGCLLPDLDDVTDALAVAEGEDFR